MVELANLIRPGAGRGLARAPSLPNHDEAEKSSFLGDMKQGLPRRQEGGQLLKLTPICVCCGKRIISVPILIKTGEAFCNGVCLSLWTFKKQRRES